MQKKILLVDDEVEALEILEKKLRENKFLVTAVSRGKDAIEACKRDTPDIVVLDIGIPDMDGYAVAEALRKDKSTKGVPILFVTGKDLEYKGLEERSATLGAFDFIMKPCKFEDILDKIKKAIFEL